MRFIFVNNLIFIWPQKVIFQMPLNSYMKNLYDFEPGVTSVVNIYSTDLVIRSFFQILRRDQTYSLSYINSVYLARPFPFKSPFINL